MASDILYGEKARFDSNVKNRKTTILIQCLRRPLSYANKRNDKLVRPCFYFAKQVGPVELKQDTRTELLAVNLFLYRIAGLTGRLLPSSPSSSSS